MRNLNMNETIKEFLRNDISRFEEAILAFGSGQIDRKTYKSLSGEFGSYAQRTGLYMLRLRLPGGRITKEKLAFLADCIRTYHLNCIKITTAQTLQFHNLTRGTVVEIMKKALDAGIVTRGCGGDSIRNVMASPLSGLQEEYFDVLPYAEAASDYILPRLLGIHLPRKLKIGFSNGPANITHATFRDLGFMARPDGNFDIYCAGGLGPNPMLGIKVMTKVSPTLTFACIDAMLSVFVQFGDYENRMRGRTRYLQDSLGVDGLKSAFQTALTSAINTSPLLSVNEDEKKESKCKNQNSSIVSYHPIGGILFPDFLVNLYEIIHLSDSAECRLSPDGTMYIVNLSDFEAEKIHLLTEHGAKTPLEFSTSCIGAELCQIGLRNSQALLRNIIRAVNGAGLPPDCLPSIHISGCLSSCGAHHAAPIGFQGSTKRVDGKGCPAFILFYGGNSISGHEKLGENMGTILEEQIPEFMVRLGTMTAESNLPYDQWIKEHESDFRYLAAQYTNI